MVRRADSVVTAGRSRRLGRKVKSGADPRGSFPEEYAACMKGEFERWAKFVKAGGIKID